MRLTEKENEYLDMASDKFNAMTFEERKLISGFMDYAKCMCLFQTTNMCLDDMSPKLTRKMRDLFVDCIRQMKQNLELL